ncbi:WecB/TagA/CpsF family glycosyltransferase [Neobacillus sp. C211]|uniref:WecB/TagA/CpsF family glycosyltransferase n=1 Tax=unclassified Neobacillus TaxID=2675272 RepID=UPI00397E05CF
MKKELLFGEYFVKANLDEFINELSNIVVSGKRVHVHTVNVDHLVIAEENYKFKDVMRKAEYVIADGMPIVWYSKLVKKHLPERITGVDLCYSIIKNSNTMGFKVFLLGAQDGVAQKARENLLKVYKDAEIVGVYSPNPSELVNEKESYNIIDMINKSGANVLFVALGAPKQELWIYQNLSKLETNINIGVGATFDFMSGSIKRAPKLIQKSGLEWLYRISQDPKRLIIRYLVKDIRFIKIVIKDLYKNYVCKPE